MQKAQVTYYSFMGIAGLINLAKGYVFAFLLGAEDFGFYSLTVVICNYLILLFSLGLVEGITIKLPWLYGEGKTEEIRAYVVSTFVRFFLVSVFITLLITAGGFLVQANAKILFLGGLQAIHSGLLVILVTDSLSAGYVVSFGKISIARALSTLMFGLVGGYMYGYEGAVVGEVLALATLIVLVLYRHGYISSSSSIDLLKANLQPFYKEGFPVLRHNSLILLQQSLDKWLVLIGMGVSALGQYSFAMIIMTGALLVHVSIGRHLGPKIIRETAQGIPLEQSLFNLFKVIGFLFALAIVAGGVIIGIAEYFLRPGLEGYDQGIDIIPIVTVAAIIQVTYLFDWFVFAGKKSSMLSYITLSATIAYGLLGWYGIANNFVLKDYAILMLSMRIVLWFITAGLSVWIARNSIKLADPGIAYQTRGK